jgi:hypothetical protein
MAATGRTADASRGSAGMLDAVSEWVSGLKSSAALQSALLIANKALEPPFQKIEKYSKLNHS